MSNVNSNTDSNSSQIAEQQQYAKDGFPNKQFDSGRIPQRNEGDVDRNLHQDNDMTLEKGQKDAIIDSKSEIKQTSQAYQPIIT
jgi:ribosomal protein L15